MRKVYSCIVVKNCIKRYVFESKPCFYCHILPVVPMWSETLWRRHLRCWRIGAGRRNLWAVCRGTTRMVPLYQKKCLASYYRAGKQMQECSTQGRYCLEHLIKPSILVKRLVNHILKSVTLDVSETELWGFVTVFSFVNKTTISIYLFM